METPSENVENTDTRGRKALWRTRLAAPPLVQGPLKETNEGGSRKFGGELFVLWTQKGPRRNFQETLTRSDNSIAGLASRRTTCSDAREIKDDAGKKGEIGLVHNLRADAVAKENPLASKGSLRKIGGANKGNGRFLSNNVARDTTGERPTIYVREGLFVSDLKTYSEKTNLSSWRRYFEMNGKRRAHCARRWTELFHKTSPCFDAPKENADEARRVDQLRILDK